MIGALDVPPQTTLHGEEYFTSSVELGDTFHALFLSHRALAAAYRDGVIEVGQRKCPV